MAELILGGQKSGKSRRAELLARDWLAGDTGRSAVLIATASGHDAEMRARIARHRSDRAARVPGLATVEEPLRLAETITALGTPHTLLVVDCLTLWLTNRLMPLAGPACSAADLEAAQQALEQAVRGARGPLLLVGNEIGLGVIPMGREVRAFVDALGTLNQRMAACCARVTLMAAGLPLVLKDDSA
ncbi:bifunctional adenosylcobinamide kinase/adenosylcobinamide-phosphate guanylyltransferase [Pseudorhodoferax sp. LjRoot39]|uniref:bifunctional adenosylcobinamide kinase/adenosylcobinamide-phosphate guanylyltransferase n=1 Tax=Pseudorhodoferax sp. LjRoot39 TaxID=3342328 RepID=UPI003ECC3561